MKNLALILSLLSSPLFAQTSTRAAGVGGGGLGGTPMETGMGVGGGGMGGLPQSETNEDTNIQILSQSSFVSPQSSLPPSLKIRPATQMETVTMERHELLQLVEQAMDTQPVELTIQNQTEEVRLHSLDLKAGVLRGQIVNSKRPVQIVEPSRTQR